MKDEEYLRGGNKLLGGVHPSVLAIWAALIAAGNLLPAIPIIGSGFTFSVSAALIPLAGIFFGPVGGAVCGAIGGFLGQIIAPHIAWLGVGTFLIGTVNAFVVGCVSRRKWYLALGTILLGYLLWFSTAIGRGAALFPLVFYSIGVVAAVLGAVVWQSRRAMNKKPVLRGVGIFLASYAGFVGAAGLANFAGILLYKWPSQMWLGLVFVSPVERAIFSLGAAIIGLPLLSGLPKIGVFVGPDQSDPKLDSLE